MHNWLASLRELVNARHPCVLVTVCGTRGSTPRETGAKMIVTRDQVIGTIGGGQLEYSCVQTACEWLRDGQANGRSQMARLVLGANCGQCCGGVVELLFEEITPAQSWWIDAVDAFYAAGEPVSMATVCASRAPARKWLITADSWRTEESDNVIAAGSADVSRPPPEIFDAVREAPSLRQYSRSLKCARATGPALRVLLEPVHRSDFDIAVFGAGHVGSACVSLLAQLDANIHWIDSRAKLLAEKNFANVQVVVAADPAAIVDSLTTTRYFLIMTHDHAVDFDLCCAILQRPEIIYCGLIGSAAKRRRFRKRLAQVGLAPLQIMRLTCPVGGGLISGKKPAEIAVSVAAELLQLRDTGVQQCSDNATAPRIAATRLDAG